MFTFLLKIKYQVIVGAILFPTLRGLRKNSNVMLPLSRVAARLLAETSHVVDVPRPPRTRATLAAAFDAPRKMRASSAAA